MCVRRRVGKEDPGVIDGWARTVGDVATVLGVTAGWPPDLGGIASRLSG